MSKRQVVARFFRPMGGVPMMQTFWGAQRLTVLAYHRIIEHDVPGFVDYRPVVSATPQMFAQQMAFVDEHFSVISLWDLQAALLEDAPLPENPLLITFDDGYADNYTHAFPILRRFGFPAVIFLVTSRMGQTSSPLWWDEIARRFHHAQRPAAELPYVGHMPLTSTTLDHLLYTLKQLPEQEKQAAVEKIRDVLGGRPVYNTALFMNWSQVREMAEHDIAFQPHTATHPILTRIEDDQLRTELTQPAQRIQVETGQHQVAFAYPNGTRADYSPRVMQALLKAGYHMAFTLTPGPMRWPRVQAHPLQIRRVYLGHKDTFDDFVMKVMGLPALRGSIGYPGART